MKIHYTTLDETLKKGIKDQSLSQEELKSIEDLVNQDYSGYYKNRKKYNRVGVVSLASLLIAIVMVLAIGVVPFEAGSSEAKTYVFVLAGFFALFLVTIFIVAFYATKFSAYIHVKHTMDLLKKYYPESYHKLKQ